MLSAGISAVHKPRGFVFLIAITYTFPFGSSASYCAGALGGTPGPCWAPGTASQRPACASPALGPADSGSFVEAKASGPRTGLCVLRVHWARIWDGRRNSRGSGDQRGAWSSLAPGSSRDIWAVLQHPAGPWALHGEHRKEFGHNCCI